MELLSGGEEWTADIASWVQPKYPKMSLLYELFQALLWGTGPYPP